MARGGWGVSLHFSPSLHISMKLAKKSFLREREKLMMKDQNTIDINQKDEYTEKISLLLDGELNATEATELKAHLADCLTCRHTYQAMQHVHQLLRNAATVMAAPKPGFPHRFQVRLAHRRGKPWQVALAIGALLLGTLFLVSAWAVMGGITLVTMSAAVFDVSFVDQWLVTFIELVGRLRVFFNLGSLFFKAAFITIQQPLFWGCVVVAVILMGLWVRVMQLLSRGVAAPAELRL